MGILDGKIKIGLFGGGGSSSSPDFTSLHDKYLQYRKQQDAEMSRWASRLNDLAAFAHPNMIPHPAPPQQPLQPVREKIPFRIDDSPNTIRYIAKETMGDNGDIELLKSMMPRMIDAMKTGPHSHSIEILPIIDRIKWRMRMAEKFNVSISIFRDEHIDENSKTDDLKLIEMCRPPVAKQQPKSIRKVFAVSQSEAAKILARLGCKVTDRTIRNWESGKGTPDNYTSEKRLSIEAFTAWAKVYAAHEKSKLDGKKAIAYRDDVKY